MRLGFSGRVGKEQGWHSQCTGRAVCAMQGGKYKDIFWPGLRDINTVALGLGLNQQGMPQIRVGGNQESSRTSITELGGKEGPSAKPPADYRGKGDPAPI